MELETVYFCSAVAGALQLIPDPSKITPPLAANPFHLLHPEGRGWTHVRLGPVTGAHTNLYDVRMAVWGWGGSRWHLLHDNVRLRLLHTPSADRADSLVLALTQPQDPKLKAEGAGPITALCALPRAAVLPTGTYSFRFAGIDTPLRTC